MQSQCGSLVTELMSVCAKLTHGQQMEKEIAGVHVCKIQHFLGILHVGQTMGSCITMGLRKLSIRRCVHSTGHATWRRAMKKSWQTRPFRHRVSHKVSWLSCRSAIGDLVDITKALPILVLTSGDDPGTRHLRQISFDHWSHHDAPK